MSFPNRYVFSLSRHIDTYKYVLILDIDEVIVPLKHDNWTKMLDHVIASSHLKSSSNSKVAEITSVSVRNVFKFPSNNSKNPDIPYYPYMLRNGRKSETISGPGEYGKAFIRYLLHPRLSKSVAFKF